MATDIRLDLVRDLRYSALWALVGAVIGFAALATNFWVVQGSYPGYRFFVYPGIVVSRLFSEELNFWPKLGVMILGQYLICLFSILVCRRLANWIVNR